MSGWFYKELWNKYASSNWDNRDQIHLFGIINKLNSS